jgi:tetratricopeptide (TPR) repeat protein
MEKHEKAAAYYGLGKDLSLIGDHAQAVEALKSCLNEEPLFYRRKPDVLKYLGQSLFGLQQYADSQKYLLWYLNLQKEAPDTDLILARVVDCLSHAGEDKVVAKVLAYLQSAYPNSEGSVIAMIRQAEALEKGDEKAQREAGSIYRELASKKVSESLARLIQYKLASWEWKLGNFDKSLEILDSLLLASTKEDSDREAIASLRDKAVVDWAKKAFSENNHLQVVHLFDANRAAFAGQHSADLDAMIADSYAEMKLYPEALNQYQEAMAKNGAKINEEIVLKMARCSFHLNDLEKAAQLCAQVRSPALESRKTELLGQIAFAQEKYPKVIEAFAKLFPAKDGAPASLSVESLSMYGESLMKVGRYDDAVTSFRKAIDALPESDVAQKARFYLLQSRCYANLKQPRKAIEMLEGALPMITAQDMRSQLLHELSGLYLETGDRDKAIQKLNELLASSDSFWKTAAQERLDSIQPPDSGKPKK